MKRLKTLIRSCSLLVVCIVLSACASSKLPDYHPTLPVKPVLEEMPDEELSEEAYRNIVKLIAYSEEQRILLDEWQEYYDNLKTIF